MYVEVFKQTFSQSKVDPSAVKKIASVGPLRFQNLEKESVKFLLYGNWIHCAYNEASLHKVLSFMLSGLIYFSVGS